MKTILLIEKHDMMRLFLMNLLNSEYDVYGVSSINEAAIWLKSRHADLILGGYSDAQQASQVIRQGQNINTKNTPWIILTDQDKSEQRIKAFSWGAKDCVSKPFNPVELKLRIQSHISSFSYSRVLESVA